MFDFLPILAYNETDNIAMAENIMVSIFYMFFCVAFFSAGWRTHGVL